MAVDSNQHRAVGQDVNLVDYRLSPKPDVAADNKVFSAKHFISSVPGQQCLDSYALRAGIESPNRFILDFRNLDTAAITILVREQFFLTATAQNIKRLVRFLSRPTMLPVPATS